VVGQHCAELLLVLEQIIERVRAAPAARDLVERLLYGPGPNAMRGRMFQARRSFCRTKVQS